MNQPLPRLVTLTTAPNEGAAGVIRATLEAEGIPTWQHTDPVYLGIWGAAGFHPTAVRVRESDLDRARAALENARRDSVDIDWSEVDVGEPEDAIAARIAARPEPHVPVRRFRPGPILVWTIVLVFSLLYGGAPGLIIALGCVIVAAWWASRRPPLRGSGAAP